MSDSNMTLQEMAQEVIATDRAGDPRAFMLYLMMSVRMRMPVEAVKAKIYAMAEGVGE